MSTPMAEVLPSRGTRDQGTYQSNDEEYQTIGETDATTFSSASRRVAQVLVVAASVVVLVIGASSFTGQRSVTPYSQSLADTGGAKVTNLSSKSKSSSSSSSRKRASSSSKKSARGKATKKKSDEEDEDEDEDEDEIDEGNVSDDLVFTLKRAGYDPLSMFTEDASVVAKYKIFDDYISVVEPSASMSIYVEDAESEFSLGNEFRYTVCPLSTANSTESCKLGEYSADATRPIKLDCTPYDTFEVTLTKYNGMTEIKTWVGQALCMYVRREIRTLSTSDLSKTMDAMHVLWEYGDEDGQDLYGENFHSSAYFSEAHTFNAAQQDSDHIHEGLGFLPQHIKITNMFERAIQAVDASVSLPYWDFTIDEAEGTSLSDSYMFTEDTFGSIHDPVDSYWGWTYRNESIASAAIPDGRWAGANADVNNMYPDLGNGFGYMRGPWNMNPSPYISRFSISTTALPSCNAYYTWMQYTDMADFLDIAPFAPHASTHGAIGAVFGCDMMDQMLEAGVIADAKSQRAICKKWGFYLKELYRSNLITPRDDCSITSLDSPLDGGIDCGFTCIDMTYSTMRAAMKALISSEWVPDDMTAKAWDTWVDYVCSGDGWRVFVGDHLESASPSDPSFWPVHPTLERLMHAKFMSGGFETSEWPSESTDVCDKSRCYESLYGTKDYHTECCYGHYEFDQLLDFTTGDRYAGFGDSNHDIMKYSNPANEDYGMTYIYDDFTWSHCTDTDSTFPELMQSLRDSFETKDER